MNKEKLAKLKEELFNKNISEDEKEKIIKKIYEEIDNLLSSINEESDPIDE